MTGPLDIGIADAHQIVALLHTADLKKKQKYIFFNEK
jgi:hypothetical protein